MKIIKTSNTNEDILVDDEDFERVFKYTWRRIGNNGSIFRNPIGLHKSISLASFLLRTKFKIDHIDRNPLNNQKLNLRFCNNSQNQANRKSNKNNTTGFRGVWLDKRRSIFYGEIKVFNQKIYLGSFYFKEDAARAYDKAAKKYFGEFAILNFPENVTTTSQI